MIEVCSGTFYVIVTVLMAFFYMGTQSYVEKPRDNWLGRIVTEANSIFNGLIPFVAAIAIPIILINILFSLKPDFMC